jgi:hypothetical protein
MQSRGLEFIPIVLYNFLTTVIPIRRLSVLVMSLVTLNITLMLCVVRKVRDVFNPFYGFFCNMLKLFVDSLVYSFVALQPNSGLGRLHEFSVSLDSW